MYSKYMPISMDKAMQTMADKAALKSTRKVVIQGMLSHKEARPSASQLHSRSRCKRDLNL